MRAMFELNSDGSVQTDGKGNPIRAPGEREDTVEKRFIYDHVQAAALNALGPAGVADLAGPGNKLILNKTATDEQKKFFHDVTGYNLESSGVFDDYGNLVPASGPQGGPVNAVWQLADKLTSNLPGGDDLATTSGDGVDKSKFSAFIEMMKKAKIAVPDSWLQKAKEYFDNTLDALNDAPDNSSKDSAPAKGENQSVT
jgi:hypothetical protein